MTMVKKKSFFFKQPIPLLTIVFVSTLALFSLVYVIKNTNLNYVPRAQEATDDGRGIDSPGTSGPLANSNDFNCQQSNNNCAEDIPCGYCRQHDTDCRMYLCVGPNYPRPNLPTYGYSVYMPYATCPKPITMKRTCSAVVNWDESIQTTDLKLETAVSEANQFQTVDNHQVVYIKNFGYLMVD